MARRMTSLPSSQLISTRRVAFVALCLPKGPSSHLHRGLLLFQTLSSDGAPSGDSCCSTSQRRFCPCTTKHLSMDQSRIIPLQGMGPIPFTLCCHRALAPLHHKGATGTGCALALGAVCGGSCGSACGS